MEEDSEDLALQVEEETHLEVDVAAVLQTMLVEVKTKILEAKTKVLVTQVAKNLISQMFNVIIVINLGIMLMSAGKSNMTSTSKVKISQIIIFKQAPCLLHAPRFMKQFLQTLPLSVMLSKKVQVTFGIWIRVVVIT